MGCFAEVSGGILRDPARTASILFAKHLCCKGCEALSGVSLLPRCRKQTSLETQNAQLVLESVLHPNKVSS